MKKMSIFIKRRKIFTLTVFLLTFLLANKVLASSDLASLPVNLAAGNISQVLYIIAFLGGALMILTPCSAATLPAYFANTFASKKKITQRTAIFFLGFATVYAFIGGGASFIGRWLNIYQEELTLLAGGVLILLGFSILLGRGFSFIKQSRRFGTSTGGTYAFGAFFGVGFSACAGPILAAMLTVASQLPTYQAILMMFFYSLGMGVPLLLLSLLFDKYKIYNWKFFRLQKKVTIAGKSFYITSYGVLSAIMLWTLAVVFIIYRSTYVLSATFPRALTDFGYSLQETFLSLKLPPYLDAFTLIAVLYGIVWFVMKKRVTIVAFISQLSLPKIKNFLIIVLILLLFANVLIAVGNKTQAQNFAQQESEKLRPAEIEIITISDESCEECFDISNVTNFLQTQKVNVINNTALESSSDDAQALINTLGITKLPVVVIKGELEKDQNFKALLGQMGEFKDDYFFSTADYPPYKDLESGDVRGIVDITYIFNRNCDECFDVSDFDAPLLNLGLQVDGVAILDVASAKAQDMIAQYDITSVPTIVIQGDAQAYEFLNRAWPGVGTIEDDGAHVFRKPEIMGSYYDIINKKLVEIASQESTQPSQSPPDSVADEVVTIVMGDFNFTPDTFELPANTKVKVKITNQGSVPHDFISDEAQVSTKLLKPGESQIIEIDTSLISNGSLTFYCSVPGHRQAGMEGKIILKSR